MSEQAMWGLLRDKSKGLVAMERITEKLNAGVPDVVYQFPAGYGLYELDETVLSPGPSGWVELKYLASAKGESVRIPWKNADQPFWLQRWVRWGGRAGVLLYVKDTGWFYWRPWQDIKWLDFIKAPVSLEQATWKCGPRLDIPGLLAELRR